jgi:2Fe-2S ferredoxin
MPTITFIDPNNTKIKIEATEGLSVLEVAHQNNIDLEGACEGSLACSTCHVIVDEDWCEKLPKASDAEEDMLDLAFGLTQTSRLGCQIIITKDLDGLTLRLPSATRNIKNQ